MNLSTEIAATRLAAAADAFNQATIEANAATRESIVALSLFMDQWHAANPEERRLQILLDLDVAKHQRELANAFAAARLRAEVRRVAAMCAHLARTQKRWVGGAGGLLTGVAGLGSIASLAGGAGCVGIGRLGPGWAALAGPACLPVTTI